VIGYQSEIGKVGLLPLASSGLPCIPQEMVFIIITPLLTKLVQAQWLDIDVGT